MSNDTGIVVPGRPNPNGNPLNALQVGIQTQTDVLVEGFNMIAHAIGAGRRHVYALEPAEMPDGSHGFQSYCLGCSEAQQSFIYPCKVMTEQQMPVPPQLFGVSPTPAPTPDQPSSSQS